MTVRSEIEAKLAQFAASQTPPLPLAYEGVEFTKPDTGEWLEIYFLDPYTQNRSVAADQHTVTGMFQVDCCGELGVGMGRVEALAREVVALFPIIPKVGIVSIEKTPNAGRGRIREDHVFAPVTVSYRAEY